MYNLFQIIWYYRIISWHSCSDLYVTSCIPSELTSSVSDVILSVVVMVTSQCFLISVFLISLNILWSVLVVPCRVLCFINGVIYCRGCPLLSIWKKEFIGSGTQLQYCVMYIARFYTMIDVSFLRMSRILLIDWMFLIESQSIMIKVKVWKQGDDVSLVKYETNDP